MALSSACELLRNLESRPASCAIWVRSSPTRLRGLTGVLLLLKRAKLLAGDPEVVSSSFSAESSKNPPITSCEDRAGLSAGGKMGELEISSRKTGGMTMWVRRNQTKKKKKKEVTLRQCGAHNVCLRDHVSAFRTSSLFQSPECRNGTCKKD